MKELVSCLDCAGYNDLGTNSDLYCVGGVILTHGDPLFKVIQLYMGCPGQDLTYIIDVKDFTVQISLKEAISRDDALRLTIFEWLSTSPNSLRYMFDR